MTISYNWLSEYLPVKLDPERLSKILTSIGLEVESLEFFESVKGGLKGLVIGEVMACEQHPNADKLKVTKVNIGEPEFANCLWCTKCSCRAESCSGTGWSNYLSGKR